jgi:hypothetical protein
VSTAQSLIEDAFGYLGLYSPGEPLSAADAARGLRELNKMVDSWSTESLSCYAINEQSLTLVPGKAAYTIGPGGDVPLTRPISLIASPGSCYAVDFNENQYQIDVLTQEQWNRRGSRNTTSNFPEVVFYDPQFPLGILKFDPIPNIGYTVYFDSYLQIAEFPTLTSPVILPPGYELALGSNLAIQIKPFYPGIALDEAVVKISADSKATIKRANIRLDEATYDPELRGKAAGTYNIYTDGYTRGS